MNKFIILLVLPLFSAIAQTYPATNGQWILDSFRSDEFSNGFDTQKWEKNGLWFSCQKETVFRDENVTVSNGKVIITAKKEPYYAPYPICFSYNGSYQYEYTTGALQSKFFIGNNTFIEVRAKTLNYQSDMTSAIWFQEKPVFRRNPNVEIDLLETLKSYVKPKLISSGIHLWVRDESDSSDYHMNIWNDTNTNYILSEGFHLYGLERNGEILKFYFDGNLIWQINIMDDNSYPNTGDTQNNFFPIEYRPYLTGQDKKLILSLEGHTLQGQTHPVDNFPQNFEIDYVRVYKKKFCPSNIVFTQPLSEVNDYQANNTITSESSISPNLIVNFKANRVILKPGFHITGNTTGRFKAYVEPCTLFGAKSENEKISVRNTPEDDLTYFPIISPNPATEMVYVSNVVNINEWKLLDINGVVVDSGNTDKLVQNSISISVRSLKSGIYYFNAILNNGHFFQKAIIKK